MKGSDIKKYLIENGIKQSYLSEKTGIPSPILNMILNDNRKIEANEYMRICDALGVPLEQFKPDKVKSYWCVKVMNFVGVETTDCITY